MGAANQPVTRAEFAAAMARFAPFERPPALAVACSGGADSMALTILAADWAQQHGGSCLALVVDHGVRAESAAECQATLQRLRSRDIPAEGLSLPRPLTGDLGAGGNLQARARAARYRALSDACRARGILHLLLGHHADDQAETVLLRQRRGSGALGLSAMMGERFTGTLRLLRPLLGVPKARLVATCRAEGLDWVEDPSNRAARFARSQARADLARADLADTGTLHQQLLTLQTEAEQEAAAAHQALAALLVQALRWREGAVWLDPAALCTAPPEVAVQAIGALAAWIGGSDYPPRHQRCETAYRFLCETRRPRFTLGHCLWSRHRRAGQDWVRITPELQGGNKGHQKAPLDAAGPPAHFSREDGGGDKRVLIEDRWLPGCDPTARFLTPVLTAGLDPASAARHTRATGAGPSLGLLTAPAARHVQPDRQSKGTLT